MANTKNTEEKKLDQNAASTEQKNDTTAQAQQTAQPTQATQQTGTGFTYGQFETSQAYKDADAVLNNLLANAPGSFNFTKQANMDSILSQIQNRPDFSYDVNADALYNQYKDQYIQQGRLAMMDTMGQAQSMTGGYGNSYAMSAGQQAYNAQLNNLNEIVPELYAQAYNRYRDETSDLYNQYGLMSSERDAEMSAYNTELSNYYNQLNTAMNRENTLYGREYGEYADAYNRAYGQYRDNVADSQWADQFQFTKDQADISNQQWDKQFAFNENQAAIGNEQWNKQFASSEEQRGIDNDYRNQAFRFDQESEYWDRKMDDRNYKLNEKQVNAALEASKNSGSTYEMSPDDYSKWTSIMGKAETYEEAIGVVDQMMRAGVPEDVARGMAALMWGITADTTDMPVVDTTVKTTVTPDEEENRKVSGPHSPSSNNNRIYLVR